MAAFQNLTLFLLVMLLIPEFTSAGAETGLGIDEILPANTYSGVDPYFSNYSGWIEIYNAGDEPVDLAGYYLTGSLKSSYRKYGLNLGFFTDF